MIRHVLYSCVTITVLLAWPPSTVGRTQQPSRPTFTANSDLVVLRIHVSDEKRGPVADLSEDDFIVYEDGRPQRVSFFSSDDLPVTVGLVIDNSSSMGPKRNEVYTAAMAFAALSHPDDEIFVVHFNERVRDGLPRRMPFTSDREVLRSVLLQTRAGGKTALYDAVAHALEYAGRGDRDQKVLLVLSDGRDNASTTTFDELEDRTAASSTVIYAVGLFPKYDRDANPRVLEKLAGLSGGDAYLPGDMEEIAPILERIAREIRTTYTLGYVPTNVRRDGAFRKLRISVRDNGKDFRVRHREGYTVEPDSAGAER